MIEEIFEIEQNKIRIEAVKKQRKTIVPFVGAGVSKSCGLLLWKELLDKLAEQYLSKDEIDKYNEQKIDLIEYAECISKKTDNESMFKRKVAEICDGYVEGKSKLPHYIVSGFSGQILTTNYDTILEDEYKKNNENVSVFIQSSKDAFTEAIVKKEKYIYKIHGSIKEPNSIILTKTNYIKQYKIYDTEKSDVYERLCNIYGSSRILFIGCGLENDYTLEILKQSIKKLDNQHYAIVEMPQDEDEKKDLNKKLDSYGILPIYYPKGKYESVDEILKYITGEESTNNKRSFKYINLNTRINNRLFIRNNKKIDSVTDIKLIDGAKKMNTEKKYKAIVLDDSKDRFGIYKALLENFEVECFTKAADLDGHTDGVDLFVLDVCLEGYNADKVLEDYGDSYGINKKPILLVSSYFTTSVGSEISMETNRKYGNNIIYNLPWSKVTESFKNFKQNGDTKGISTLKDIIFSSFLKARKQLKPNNKTMFTILHISDLQFGEKEIGSAANDDQRIAKALLDNHVKPDAIVITGDIANSGDKKEYDAAREWIENLIKELHDKKEIDDDLRKRIILVPGNHDYLISASAVDKYKYDFGTGKFVEKESDNYPNQKLGFMNFIYFAYELTGDEKWFRYLENITDYIDVFRDAGICFLTLNTAYNINSDNCDSSSSNNYCGFNGVDSKQFRNTKDLNKKISILVMHNPLDDYFRDGKRIDYNKLETIIHDNDIKICLSGHVHGDSTCFLWGREPKEDLLCINAPTVRLGAGSRCEDAMRGFNVIQVENVNESETLINVDMYKIINVKISCEKHKKYKLTDGLKDIT